MIHIQFLNSEFNAYHKLWIMDSGSKMQDYELLNCAYGGQVEYKLAIIVLLSS